MSESKMLPATVAAEHKDIEEYVLSFFRANPRMRPEKFQGKYHHLKFKWWKGDGTKISPERMHEILDSVEHEERLQFMLQYVWAILYEYETELLEAAFGPAPKGYKKVE
ncbi:pyruvate-formate lyase-activating enzyme [Paenibacillus sp. RC84]|uniref:pyruvate-formate lyase-activating enzyme n=1 Tax=Paenibacillus sp. RC84 TaxID=3156252 RepID=UPI0035188AFC